MNKYYYLKGRLVSLAISALLVCSHNGASGEQQRALQTEPHTPSANFTDYYQLSGGFAAKEDCPCIDSSVILGTATTSCNWNEETVTIDANGKEEVVVTTYTGILHNGKCFPITYGANECNSYDSVVHDVCKTPGVEPAAFCSRPFCYVDIAQCRKSKRSFFRSSFAEAGSAFENLYYSYSTCNSSEDAWFAQETIDAFNNRTLTVAIPQSTYPRHYKAYKDGQVVDEDFPDIAFDDDFPWKGFIVDYLDAILEISNIPAVKYVHRSGGSTEKGYASKWTQTVTDVEAGIADLAIASFWVTAERLRMTPFTVPIITDTFKLYIEQPELESQGLQNNAARLLAPFSRDLWLLILLVIVLFGVLSAIVSPAFFRADVEERRNRTFRENRGWLAGLYADGIIMGFMSFLQGNVDIDMSFNASKKILDLGFAFVIFVVVCAYSANLAALLVITNTGTYVSDIETAIARKMAICSMIPLKDDLMALYPNANWVWATTELQMMELYDDGKCSALLQGWVDNRGDQTMTKLFCERDLVRVGPPILEKPVAFPADSKIVAGLSHWITEGRNRGIEFEDFLLAQEAPCTMEVALGGMEEDELPVVTPTNLTLPLSFFGICCVLALATHVSSQRSRKGESKSCFPSADETTTPYDSQVSLDIDSMMVKSSSRDSIPEQAPRPSLQQKFGGRDEESPHSPLQSPLQLLRKKRLTMASQREKLARLDEELQHSPTKSPRNPLIGSSRSSLMTASSLRGSSLRCPPLECGGGIEAPDENIDTVKEALETLLDQVKRLSAKQHFE